ncbi:heavy-metal-associated domain-containing protein [Bibersteinia trehalosi]|uniref:heavy-metal-associated domain-containing protein n=1 Tax=Bibersteinia trehalosi TaxID=47735 RepID=UPI002D795C9B|nr:heavy-metal-associated domain-containing protein [Bibersteinia trehalosi]
MLKKLLLTFLSFSALANFAQATEKKTMTFHIPEMYCQLCVYLVNKEVREVEGVMSSKASFKERNMVIVAQQHVQEADIVNAIKKLNYSATLIK